MFTDAPVSCRCCRETNHLILWGRMNGLDSDTLYEMIKQRLQSVWN
jgi:hypothetical protein